jgi:hypothetical protein
MNGQSFPFRRVVQIIGITSPKNLAKKRPGNAHLVMPDPVKK